MATAEQIRVWRRDLSEAAIRSRRDDVVPCSPAVADAFHVEQGSASAQSAPRARQGQVVSTHRHGGTGLCAPPVRLSVAASAIQGVRVTESNDTTLDSVQDIPA